MPLHISDTVRQQFENEIDAVQPGFSTPVEPRTVATWIGSFDGFLGSDGEAIMTTLRFESNKAVMACALQGLVLGIMLLIPPQARADGYSECNQILAQDIFNRIIKSDASSSAFAAEAKAAFYQQSDTEAFDAYRNARDEAKKNGTKINTEFHYGIIGGELGIDLNSEEEVSEEKFRQSFNKAKSTYQSSSASKTSSSQNLVSSYASYVRDSGTVGAWKDCVTRTRETNLYAFASRDSAGKTFINVMWVPGALAGTVPSIPVDFVTDGDAGGVVVHADRGAQVAMGSGRNFAVSCGTKCDNGFRIVVNGTLKNAAGTVTSSFTNAVDVPALNPPTSTKPPRMAGVWRHVLDGASVGVEPQIERIRFTPNGEDSYDVLFGSGRDAAKGIATLTGNHLQVNFETPLSGSIGQINWELNSTFTEGVGTIELHAEYLPAPMVLTSKIFRIE